MKDRKMIAIILLMVYFCSCCMFLRDHKASEAGQQTYVAATQLVTGPGVQVRSLSAGEYQHNAGISFIDSDPNAEFLLSLDLNALKEVNPDVIGWIYIPGTNISYPLMQGQDNDYYLNYTWDRQKNYVGSIFMETTCASDFSDFNTILYGHNLRNNTMFSQLHKYKDQKHYEQYPYIYIVTENGVYRYEIFSAFEVPTNASAYRVGFRNTVQKEAFLADSQNQNILQSDSCPTLDDRILTLSTCTGVIKSNRWVVQAVFDGQIIQNPQQTEKTEQNLQ